MKIEFYKHPINKEDIDRADEVLKSIFLTTGKMTKVFEDEFTKYLKTSHVIGTTSCTAALHLALVVYGIGKGDEVITTPMSFCATSNSILHAGAVPVFVDVEETTGNINAEAIESKITKKTKAIIPVHLYGHMCDMKKIRSIARKYHLVVIEDAAHCIEGMRDGIKVGQLSDAACFSFYATKNITSGEGGAVSTNNSGKAKLLKMLRLHGMNKPAAERYTHAYQHWDIPVLGWKYNMNDIQAALLIGQLKRIESLWKKRNKIWKKYESDFRSSQKIRIMKTMPAVKHARHLFTILVPEGMRDRILVCLQKKGIGVAVNYRAIHLLEYYRKVFGYKRGDFPIAENIGDRTISLPLYPSLKEKEIDYIIKTVLDKIDR